MCVCVRARVRLVGGKVCHTIRAQLYVYMREREREREGGGGGGFLHLLSAH